MSWVSQILQFAGNRVIHIPASEVQAYVDAANSIRNPESDPSVVPLTVTDWRAMEKAFLTGISAHAVAQLTPRALSPMVNQVLPIVVQPVQVLP
jgi:hypothetical protein